MGHSGYYCTFLALLHYEYKYISFEYVHANPGTAAGARMQAGVLVATVAGYPANYGLWASE